MSTHRLHRFDFRAHALAHAAEQLLPLFEKVEPAAAPKSLEGLVELAEKQPAVLKDLLDKVEGNPDVAALPEVAQAVEALRDPETFQVAAPAKPTRRVARKDNEIRARIEHHLAEAFRRAADGEGLSSSQALRDAIVEWCRVRGVDTRPQPQLVVPIE